MRGGRSSSLGLLAIAAALLACAKTPLRVCPISLVDAHAGLLVLRDNPMPDEFELLASRAWVDARPTSILPPDESPCTMRQVVARAPVKAGEHHLVIASLYRGRGLWSGATWRMCQELALRFASDDSVVVRTALRKSMAVDPLDRVGFAVRVEPPSAWIRDESGADLTSPEALELCRSLAGYEEL